MFHINDLNTVLQKIVSLKKSTVTYTFNLLIRILMTYTEYAQMRIFWDPHRPTHEINTKFIPARTRGLIFRATRWQQSHCLEKQMILQIPFNWHYKRVWMLLRTTNTAQITGKTNSHCKHIPMQWEYTRHAKRGVHQQVRMIGSLHLLDVVCLIKCST